MNAIISKGDKTAHVQLPVGRKQLSGALSYLGANHTSDYDLKYNEENKDGLKVSFVLSASVQQLLPDRLGRGTPCAQAVRKKRQQGGMTFKKTSKARLSQGSRAFCVGT